MITDIHVKTGAFVGGGVVLVGDKVRVLSVCPNGTHIVRMPRTRKKSFFTTKEILRITGEPK